MQAVLTIQTLPQSGILASTVFAKEHLNKAVALIGDDAAQALAIVLPAAGPDHDDWRRTLARDLARAHTPIRVNVVGDNNKANTDTVLAYLRNAPGVTGQYLATHE
ncbi:MAG: Rossmann fold domain-containing protein [Erythrobacter sp.]